MDAQFSEWIVHSVGAGGIALLWFFFTRDKKSISDEIRHLRERATANREHIIRIQEQHDNFEDDVKDLKTVQKEMNGKLDRILYETKRRPERRTP